MSGMHAAEMWPRFEDGAPVDIGSEALLPGGTGGCRVFRVTVDECGWSVYGFGGRTAVGGVATRVRRPPVLGKDGKAIEPGDAVWGEDGMNWLVTAIRWDKGNHIVEATARGEVKQLKPGWLTHEEPPKPVLDRDGVPIEVGDTVYVVGNDWAPQKVTAITNYAHPIVHCEFVKGFPYEYAPDRLTHERPDSWERLEEDAAESPYGYWGCEGGECCDCPALVNGETPRKRFNTQYCSEAVRLDIVRRAKALAGVVGDE